MNEYLKVGVITTTHGLKGEMKLRPFTDYPEMFFELDTLYMEERGSYKAFVPEYVRDGSKGFILKLEGIDRIEEAQLLRGRDIYVHRDQEPPLEDGEYFIADLIGLKVVDEDGKHLGKLKDVLVTGGHDVYVVSREDLEDLMIPAIKECILEVSIEEGTMRVHLLPGLAEVYQEKNKNNKIIKTDK